MKALMIAVKELCDNSLDACQEAGILPEVTIKVRELSEDRARVSVEDNGPGIVKEQIPRVFGKLLYGSKFYKYRQSLTNDQPIIIQKDGKIEVIKIGEFVDSYLDECEEIKDVSNLNILAPAFDNKGKYAFRKVSHVIRHHRENEILKIKTQNGREIKVTGCHSLFTFNENTQKIVDTEARSLKEGNLLVVPKVLPQPEIINKINILDYLTEEDIKKNWFYVYNINHDVLKGLFDTAEIIHKITDKNRKYYRLKTGESSIDILDDSAKQYLSKNFLPLWMFIKLNLKKHSDDCIVQTYYHGEKTKLPLNIEITPLFARLLGLFVAEGHTDVRQIGFTLGLHEDHLINELLDSAKILGLNFTVERRERSIRIKLFGNMLSIIFRKWCGRGAKNKRVPEFIFRSPKNIRQHFLDALYQGDGHRMKKKNELTIGTASNKLADDVQYLWLMQGVPSTRIKTRTSKGLGKELTTSYIVSIFGKSINQSFVYHANGKLGTLLMEKNLSLMNNSDMLANSDVSLLKIKNIEIINEGYNYVYDLSVPGYENFIGGTGGVSCHNSRGQQGIGVSAALLYSQLTTGKPAIVISRTAKGKTAHEMHIRIDTSKNEPEVIKDEKFEGNFNDHGTYVEMEMEGKYRKGDRSVDEFIKQCAIANPFAKLVYHVNGEKITYSRIVDQLPKQPKQIKPHPQGVEMGVFEKMTKMTKARSIAGFLSADFTRVGPGTAREILKLSKVNPNMKPENLSREEMEKVWRNLQKTKLMNPPTDCLSPIGENVLEQAIKKDIGVEFAAAITRKPSVYRGMPFLIETCIGWGGKLDPKGNAQIMRFANRVPLLYQSSSCAITKAVQDISWKSYHVEHSNNNPTGPLVIVVHMASVWIPYTSESKEAIDPYDEIEKEIKLAIQDCARKLKSYLAGQHRRQLEGKRKGLFEKYLPEIAVSLSYLSNQPKDKIIKDLEKILKKGVIDEIEDENNKPPESEEK